MNEPLQQEWDVKTAIDEFKELLGNVSCLPEINKFIEHGKSVFVINKVDLVGTERTGKPLVSYKLADSLKVLLSTIRANDIDS